MQQRLSDNPSLKGFRIDPAWCQSRKKQLFHDLVFMLGRGEPAVSSFSGRWQTCSATSKTQSSAQHSGLAELELQRLERLFRQLLPDQPNGPSQQTLPLLELIGKV